MSNKYEREIEEILRNLERTEPKAAFGKRPGGRPRGPRGNHGFPTLHLDFAEWCLVIAFVAALCAGGWAYAHGGADLATGIMALIGAVFIALVVISPFLAKPRYSSPRGRYSNVTPLRSNPLSRIGTRWHLLMLKVRYRKRKDQER